MAIDGLSCWAGAGDCSRLRLRLSTNVISAAGEGSGADMGVTTTISIDRRSGLMRLSQGRNADAAERPGPQSENASLVCDGGKEPQF